MKRTNLVLDADLLEKARRRFGTRTYSATVNLALEEALRARQVQDLASFFGSGIWEGSLAEMRDDALAASPCVKSRARGRH
ncbi:MAG: type II toxin-antitoxin system VapB family antitoxin [Terriglobales bacterium]